VEGLVGNSPKSKKKKILWGDKKECLKTRMMASWTAFLCTGRRWLGGELKYGGGDLNGYTSLSPGIGAEIKKKNIWGGGGTNIQSPPGTNRPLRESEYFFTLGVMGKRYFMASVSCTRKQVRTERKFQE